MPRAGKQSDGKPTEGDEPAFLVRPTKQAHKKLFKTPKEKLWVLSQLKLLRHWPLDEKRQLQLGSDLDFSKVHHRNETFYELRLDDAQLHQKNLRVFFWICGESRTAWVIHGYWKKTNRLDDAVKTLVARRIKGLKGGIHDGSVK